MTDKSDDDPNAWFAAQFAGADDTTPPEDLAPKRPARIDGDLPLRRPVLPTGGGYTWGLTPSTGPTTQASDADADANSEVDPAANDVAAAAADTDAAAVAAAPRPAMPAAPRPYFPPPVSSSPLESNATSAPAYHEPAPDEPAVAQSSTPPPVSAMTPVPAASATPAPAPGEAPDPIASASSGSTPASQIPTIEQVLDSPSPRRAAREAAAREAAMLEAARRGETAPAAASSNSPPVSAVTPESAGGAPSAADPSAADPSAADPTPADPARSDADADADSANPTAPSGLIAPPSEHPATTGELHDLFGLGERPSADPVEPPPATSVFPTPAPAPFPTSTSADFSTPAPQTSGTRDAPRFDPNAPFFVEQRSAAPELAASMNQQFPKIERDAGEAKRSTFAEVEGGAADDPDDSSKPRNQRVVLIVLIGLVLVLGVVVAVNFFL